MSTGMKENKQFRILSALGIIFVVAGHLGFYVFEFGGLFPHYSFHVFIFLFVSGYFYKDESENNIRAYIWKKMYHIVGPIFCLEFVLWSISTDTSWSGIFSREGVVF